MTAIMASAGTTKTAKRTATVHLLFNVIGATLFTLITLLTPFTSLIKSLSPDNVMMQISIVHIIFNIVTTSILLPLSNYLVKLACKIIPGEDRQRENLRLQYLDQRILNTPPYCGCAGAQGSGAHGEIGADQLFKQHGSPFL